MTFIPSNATLLSCVTSALMLLTATGFGVTTPLCQKGLPKTSSSLYVSSETFYKAVKIAEGDNIRTSALDELDELATELEEFVGCKYEEDSTQDICDKEIQDRIDVAEILRLQIELKLRKDYLKNGNLFAEDVRKEHDADERRKFKEALIANRDKVDSSGSDLGLW